MSKLYIVPTPIGNLDDITLRAIKTLKEADYILAEDTRTTSFLLKHLGIEKKLYSHHKFNEHATAASVAEAIGEGRTVALVSDAGTPGISDPGFLLVRTCVEAGIEVETLPGATALIPALVQSGFPCDRFCFEGFLPQKKGRMKRLEELKDNRQVQESAMNRANATKKEIEDRVDKLVQEITSKTQSSYNGTFCWPLPATNPGYFSRGFVEGYHTGLDIHVGGWVNNGKVPALSIAAGTVIRCGSYWD
jgi:16S rRNA (cytidine1402-2'-O)-methyltransferase